MDFDNTVITNEDNNIIYAGIHTLEYINRKYTTPLGYSSGTIDKSDVVILFDVCCNKTNEYSTEDLNVLGVEINKHIKELLLIGVYKDNEFNSILKFNNDLSINTVFKGNEIKITYFPDIQRLCVQINNQKIVSDMKYLGVQMIIYNESGLKYFRDNNPESRKTSVRGILNRDTFDSYYIPMNFKEKSICIDKFFCNNICNAIKSLNDKGNIILSGNKKIYIERNDINIFNTQKHCYTILSEADNYSNLKKHMKIYDSCVDSSTEKSYIGTDAFNFLGIDERIKKVKYLLNKASQTNITILLTGESGTGKTYLASAIHKNSKRSKYPFIQVNCAAIPYSLVESELFGYERGAFTNANKEGKVGYFELANNGTIFLDEISEIPIDLQAKLLEVIQNQSFYRIGGTKKINVNVRIITATNKNLKSLIEQNKFREDLYYRVNVFPIEIPPLRDRTRDLYFIISNILPDICKQFDYEPLIVNCEALRKMSCYSWPGNIRELENILKKAVILSNGKVIMPDDIDLPSTDSKEFTLKEQMNSYEKQIILKCLQMFNGERIKTARYLNIGRTNLFEKIKKYDIKI